MTPLLEMTYKMDVPSLGDPFLTEDELTKGKVVGYRDCTSEGCRYVCIGVRWPDGKLTWPCSRWCGATKDGTWKVGP